MYLTSSGVARASDAEGVMYSMTHVQLSHGGDKATSAGLRPVRLCLRERGVATLHF
jgi:hypothetical protein